MSFVGVALFCINATILDNVFECIDHETSETAIITLWLYIIRYHNWCIHVNHLIYFTHLSSPLGSAQRERLDFLWH